LDNLGHSSYVIKVHQNEVDVHFALEDLPESRLFQQQFSIDQNAEGQEFGSQGELGRSWFPCSGSAGERKQTCDQPMSALLIFFIKI